MFVSKIRTLGQHRQTRTKLRSHFLTEVHDFDRGYTSAVCFTSNNTTQYAMKINLKHNKTQMKIQFPRDENLFRL